MHRNAFGEVCFTRPECFTMAETIMEVTTCLTPEFWDSVNGERRSVSDDLFALAEATERVTKGDGVEWGGSYDYYEFVDLLADRYMTHATTIGCVAGRDGIAEDLVRGALRAQRIEV